MTRSGRPSRAPARERPVLLRSGIYCSPYCGMDCTKAAYDQASAEARALAARMGTGWIPMVWENVGWCYSVEKGVAEIFPQRRGSAITGGWKVVGYAVYFRTAVQIIAHAESPDDALGSALQNARTAQRRIAADCAALS